MRNIRLSILALSAATVFSACNSKLDQSPANSLDDKAAINESNVRILANGMYERAQELEYYGRDFMVVTDVAGNDMKITASNSGRFLNEFQYTFLPLIASQVKTWQNAYRVANQASVIIDKLPTNSNTAPYKGEAYFMRALAHFDLVRRYTQPYLLKPGGGSAYDMTAANTGIALITSAVENPGTYKPSRATLAASYAAIIADLKEAQKIAQTKDFFRGSKDAATALLTRAYLYTGDWKNVIAEAKDLITNYPLWNSDSYLSNFTGDTKTTEDIFSLRFLSNENRGSNNFGYIYLPADGGTAGGYGDIRLTDNFMKLLEDGDKRKSVVREFAGANYLIKWQGNAQGFTGMVNVKVLRISEVLLNRAEAYNEDGQAQLALNDVNALRTSRGLKAFTETTKDALRAEIVKQRRLELVGEGHGMTDVFRKGLIRSIKDKDAILPQTPDIDINNKRIYFPIPQAEIDANPNMAQSANFK
ncbi:RagB/SusD family nutrient uptake outer membrane protein [Chitinophaga sp. Mgbs1]|uniref:RagB/SusD family nutrient uptake outer membrane protein n=1 Tax=Chitinophaga solisilvae TaxID=1233460 RepID=A0A3S1AUP3_9BACT|nr:RagB/SusD family nutrient uptake outer membrane protein [Chitinophaga solisilvae]